MVTALITITMTYGYKVPGQAEEEEEEASDGGNRCSRLPALPFGLGIKVATTRREKEAKLPLRLAFRGPRAF